MKKLTEGQVELAERYATAMRTIERLQHLLPAEADIELFEAYVGNLSYVLDHTDDWSEADCELAAEYAGNLHEIQELSENCMNEVEIKRAANYARDLRDIVELTS